MSRSSVLSLRLAMLLAMLAFCGAQSVSAQARNPAGLVQQTVTEDEEATEEETAAADEAEDEAALDEVEAQAEEEVADEQSADEQSDEGEAEEAEEEEAEEEVDPAEARKKEMTEEKAELQLEYQLMQQRQQNELAAMELEVKRLEAEMNLARTKLQADLSDMKLEMERFNTEKSREAAMRSRALDGYKIEAEMLAAQNEALKQKLMKVQTESQLEQLTHQAELAGLDREFATADARDKERSRVLRPIDYRRNPYQDGVLYISDRRIPFNGVVTMTLAEYVAERIQFFNNQSKEEPIFIVIDSSPGGSVMAGYRILKAMEASDAPIHVVVKSYAASMAAITTTLAEHSYAFENAIILHHQMAGSVFGNMTELDEQLKLMKEWARRIMVPLSKKLGTTPEQLVDEMYDATVTGDWELFADQAAEKKWVDHIVREVREEAVERRPDENGGRSIMAAITFDGEEQTDAEGRRFKRLPRLAPYDFYMIHNPDQYYRM